MLQKIAKKYNVNIIGGSIILKGMTNSCPVINRNGELVCTYDKNHLFLTMAVMKESILPMVKIPLWLN